MKTGPTLRERVTVAMHLNDGFTARDPIGA
jgi:hypothetical protein